MKVVKKYFVFAVVCLMSVMASAQNFKIKSVDARANLRNEYGLGVGVTMGVGVFDFAPSCNYYICKGADVMTIDADVHYNFDMAMYVKVYPIVGLAILHTNGDTQLGGNIGGGVAYQLTNHWAAKAEAKYQIVKKDYDDFYLSVGMSYNY